MLLLPFSMLPGVVHAQSVPTGLTATGGPGRITLSWTASDFPMAFPAYESVYNAFYRVYRSTTPGGEDTPIAEVDETDPDDDPPDPPTTYTDTNVTPGTTYYYTVTAVLETISLFGPHDPETGNPVPSIGETGMSNEASATPTPPAPPYDGMSYFTTIRDTDWTYAGYGGMRGLGTGTLTLTGVTGAVTHAYLYWHGPTNTDDPAANAAVTFAGHGITGTNIGVAADNYWPPSINSQAYRADVTSLVTGNGSYDLAGFTNDVADINGVSLIVFYDGDPAHYRDVILFDGNDSNEVSGSDDSILAPTWDALSGGLSAPGPHPGTRRGVKPADAPSLAPFDLLSGDATQPWDETFNGVNYLGGDATLYLGVSDGQQAPEGEVDINGAMLMPDGDNFDGDSVPNGPSVPSLVPGGLWDIKGYVLSSFLHAGANTLHLTADLDSDLLSLVYAVVDQPSAGATPGPLRPMNLAATAGDAQVSLSWSPVAGVTYTLSRALSAAGPFQPVATDLTATAYTDTGLTDGTTYYYVVTAADAFGTSAPSNVAQATPRPAPDFALSPAESGLTLAQGASGTAALTVSPVNGFTGGVSLDVDDDSGILGDPGDPYSIAATLAPGDVTLDGTGAATATLSLSVGAQVPPGVYPLQVTGYDDATGTLTHSATVSVTVSAVSHISSVTIDKYAAKTGDTGTGAVTLDGLAPDDELVLISSDNPALNLPTQVTVSAGTDIGHFNYTVGAVSEVTRVTVSATYNGTATIGFQVFPAFGLVAMATGQNTAGNAKITLYWDAADGARVYNIYRATVAGGPYTKIASNVNPIDNGSGVTNGYVYTDSDAALTFGTEYFYYVVAVVDSAGTEGVSSNEASAVSNVNAIPWDTADPTVIVPQVNAMVESSFTENDTDVGVLVIAGPDGVNYEGNYPDGSTPQALPALWHYDASSNDLVYVDGTTVPAPPGDAGISPGDEDQDFQIDRRRGSSANWLVDSPFLDPLLRQQPNFPYPSKQPGPSGIYRRVDSQPGYKGLASFVSLPDPTENDPWVSNSTYLASPNDTGYIYSGGNVYRNHTPVGDLDVGLQLGNTNGDIAWKPTILPKNASLISAALGNPINFNANVNHVLSEVMPDQPILFEFEAPGFAGVPDHTVVLHIEGHILATYLDPNPQIGRQTRIPCSAVTYVYAGAGLSDWTTGSSDIIKRANSIAQDFTHGYTLKQADGVGGGFHKDQSFIYGAAWGTVDPDYESLYGTYLLPGGEWNADHTWREGSYPASAAGYVGWTNVDGLFDEEPIDLRNDTSVPYPFY